LKPLAWLIFVAACLILMIGCVPERVVWSPDGTRAAILGDDGVYVCDADGKIGPMVAPVGPVVEWMPDGKGLVALHDETFATWNDVAAAFPAQSKALAADSETLGKVREDLLAAASPGRSADDFDKVIKPGNADKRCWAVMYLRDHEADALRTKLGDRWQALADTTYQSTVVRVYTLHNDKAEPGPILWHGVDKLFSLRVSPTGRAVAIASTGEHVDPVQLVVAATDGSGAICDLGEGALYPDWSPDGKYLIYVKPSGPAPQNGDNGRLGMLVRRQVVDDAGAVLDSNKVQVPAEESLVGLLFDGMLRVRVARDGRIFFIAADVTLPTTPVDVNPHPTLFSIDPGRQATVTRVVPRGAENDVGDAPQFFELSPDATHLSVPFQDGRVAVIDLATGKADMVQPNLIGGENDHDRLTTVPEWRSTTELTFVRPKEAGGPAAEVVRYSVADQSTVIMSADWPAEVKEKWLPPPAPATQAATAPAAK